MPICGVLVAVITLDYRFFRPYRDHYDVFVDFILLPLSHVRAAAAQIRRSSRPDDGRGMVVQGRRGHAAAAAVSP
jgi:hypothetical protein